MHPEQRQKRIWWLFASAIAVSCVVLGVLQYAWIGEVSIAERERMQASLHGSLQRLSRDFNGELSSAIAALHPVRSAEEGEDREALYLARYERWKETSPHHPNLFKRIALAVPGEDNIVLSILDTAAGEFRASGWPAEWAAAREHLAMRRSGGGGFGGRGGPGQMESTMLVEIPRFRRMMAREPGEGAPMRPTESEWLLLEVNEDYLRATVLPALLRRHLGASDYDAAVTWYRNPAKLVFRNDDDFTGKGADAAVRIFDVQFENLFRRGPGGGGPPGGRGGGGGPRFFGRGGPGGRPPGEDKGPPPQPNGAGPGGGDDRGAPPERGRWLLSVRHRAGSLEAVVERGRWRNLAILAGLLAMMLAALAALIRFTQREQRLARLQMDFVAGVSHELRTPLSVIRTAAHNLHGGLVSNPKQIQRYGALIRDESERLTGIVEQVLRFAGAQAGHVIQAREPVRVEALIDDALAATSRVTDEAGCLVEREIAPGLPLISGDPVALKHAVINLVSNAAKYGFSGGWIGVRARPVEGAVEISVQDRGPGIQAEDQPYLFDAFYRGKKAIEDQTHGTGLGLNLVKRIAEAHGGSVSVNSKPGSGTEFTLRIPSAPEQVMEADEFADTIDRG